MPSPLLKRAILVAITFLLLTSCHQESEKSINQLEAVCDKVSLKTQADSFIEDLKTQDVSKIALNYQGSSQYTDLIQYAFFPHIDNNALFNFREWSKDKTILAHILGDYDGGSLVIFSNKEIKNYTTFIKTENKFESFFVCNFICEKDRWKISARHTCFEETGAPFK